MSFDTTQSQSRVSASLAVFVGLLIALFGSPLLGQLDVSDRLSTTTTGSMLINSVSMWVLVAAVFGITYTRRKRRGLSVNSRSIH